LLTLDQALTIAQTAIDHGRAEGFAPLCIVVLDPGAHALALLRDERASIHRGEIATAKAASCIGLGFGGRELARRAQANPGFVTIFASILPKGLMPAPGGVLIRSADGTLLGAVGVSGDSSERDEVCAVAGITAAGVEPDTG
jgi:uncharacterized protein GlcG (DUF336 family)